MEHFKNEDFTLDLVQGEDLLFIRCSHFMYGDNIILFVTEDNDALAKTIYEYEIDKLIMQPPEYLIHLPDKRVFYRCEIGVGRF